MRHALVVLALVVASCADGSNGKALSTTDAGDEGGSRISRIDGDAGSLDGGLADAVAAVDGAPVTDAVTPDLWWFPGVSRPDAEPGCAARGCSAPTSLTCLPGSGCQHTECYYISKDFLPQCVDDCNTTVLDPKKRPACVLYCRGETFRSLMDCCLYYLERHPADQCRMCDRRYGGDEVACKTPAQEWMTTDRPWVDYRPAL